MYSNINMQYKGRHKRQGIQYIADLNFWAKADKRTFPSNTIYISYEQLNCWLFLYLVKLFLYGWNICQQVIPLTINVGQLRTQGSCVHFL